MKMFEMFTNSQADYASSYVVGDFDYPNFLNQDDTLIIDYKENTLTINSDVIKTTNKKLKKLERDLMSSGMWGII